ncbi:aquaporin [Vagococcus sp. PNs007]|uniref:Aquaporin n=1 Tax=Vagococcus proximus TaxID=2991417 RepID=A0ABT5WZP4_9ENTE|nr:aquaporin [Vagococcus proximus]MDF0479199.1 aquaporin [Vagococcus proximus]
MAKKIIAEIIGTFVLVLFGTGTAVLGGGADGVGILGVSVAFGLSIVAMAYTIGVVSGCHINPAVTLSMIVNKRMDVKEGLVYMVSQVVGAILGSATLFYFLSTSSLETTNMGQNSFGTLGGLGSFIAEVILTFVFVLVIVTVTGKHGINKMEGLVIGFTLILIHLLGIPMTGTSVNPARSIGPALFAGGEALSQLWVFIVAPMVGAALAAIVGKFVLSSEEA